MDSTVTFRRHLLDRLRRAAALSLPAVVVLASGCSSNVAGGGGAGGASASASSSSSSKAGVGGSTASAGVSGSSTNAGAGTGYFVYQSTECFTLLSGAGGGGGMGGGPLLGATCDTGTGTSGTGGASSGGAGGAGGASGGGATTSATTGGSGSSVSTGTGSAGAGVSSSTGTGDYTTTTCPHSPDLNQPGIVAFFASQQGSCCCYNLEKFVGGGRPFLVEERVVTAAPRRSSAHADWSAELAPETRGLDADQRRALAEAWLQDGLFEHASIASFGRFAFELLAAGAPPALIAGAHRAALDEVRHAELCFGLASAYAGERVEPAGFPFASPVEVRADLAALAAATAREGCIGETIAAIQAAEQLARAVDPAVREALGVIAEDEARHAELAWSTVAWAIRTGGERVRAAVARVFEEALSEPASAMDEGADDEALLAHGRLGEAARRSVARRALADVVAPCARAWMVSSAPS